MRLDSLGAYLLFYLENVFPLFLWAEMKKKCQRNSEVHSCHPPPQYLTSLALIYSSMKACRLLSDHQEAWLIKICRWMILTEHFKCLSLGLELWTTGHLTGKVACESLQCSVKHCF